MAVTFYLPTQAQKSQRREVLNTSDLTVVTLSIAVGAQAVILEKGPALVPATGPDFIADDLPILQFALRVDQVSSLVVRIGVNDALLGFQIFDIIPLVPIPGPRPNTLSGYVIPSPNYTLTVTNDSAAVMVCRGWITQRAF